MRVSERLKDLAYLETKEVLEGVYGVLDKGGDLEAVATFLSMQMVHRFMLLRPEARIHQKVIEQGMQEGAHKVLRHRKRK